MHVHRHAHNILGGKGTKKIPHMQAYAGKNAKYFIFTRDLACFDYSAKGAEVHNLRQECIGEGLQVGHLFRLDRTADGEGWLDEIDVLAWSKEFLHHTDCLRCPRAVFYHRDTTVLETFETQFMQEHVHRRENIAIVRCATECEPIHAERILDSFRHIVTAQVGDSNLKALAIGFRLSFEDLLELFGYAMCITMDRGIGDEHTIRLDTVCAPD